MSKGGNHSKAGGSLTKTSGYSKKDKIGQQKFGFNKQKPKTGQTKYIKGRLYELHPTKGWVKQRRVQAILKQMENDND